MYPLIKVSHNNNYTPIKITDYCQESVNIKIVDTSKMLNNFFHLVAKSFGEYEHYISKVAMTLDLEEMADIINNLNNYKHLLDGTNSFFSKKFIKKSILFFNKEKKSTIVHFYLKKEPDMYSEWKIYYIKKEKNFTIKI